jgi:hypothetical protein
MPKIAAFCSATALALLLPLAACSGGPPWPLAHSSDSVALRWYVGDVSGARADQIAALDCATEGRHAILTGDARHGSVEIARYDCRPPPLR